MNSLPAWLQNHMMWKIVLFVRAKGLREKAQKTKEQ